VSPPALLAAGSIVALLLAYFAIYRPLIIRLDTEIKNVRSLLLLFPDEVSRGVPAIIEHSREMLKDAASVVSSRTR